MSRIQQRLSEKLKQRAEQGNLRSLPAADRDLVDFYSNDYLGLAKNEELKNRITQAFSQVNLSNINGSTGSRLLSGNSGLTEALEARLALLFYAEKTLLFNSGYNANLSILAAVPQKGDTIIYDELIHASLKEGARLSFAKRFAFKHNDPQDLRKKIAQAEGQVFVIIESVYSMDGDLAALYDIVEVCHENDACLIVDEAHSTGLWGQIGEGFLCDAGLHNDVFARIYTFGKGMGVHGACIAGSKVLIDYLVNFARPFIYTTALPPHSILAIDQAFSYLAEHHDLQLSLKKNIQLFRSIVNDDEALSNAYISSESGIHVFEIPGNDRVKQVASALQAEGFDVRPIMSPTVKEGQERLRVCLHTYNTADEITRLLTAVKEQLIVKA